MVLAGGRGSNTVFKSRYLLTSGFRRLEREHVFDRGRVRHVFPCASPGRACCAVVGAWWKPASSRGPTSRAGRGAPPRRLVRAITGHPLS